MLLYDFLCLTRLDADRIGNLLGMQVWILLISLPVPFINGCPDGLKVDHKPIETHVGKQSESKYQSDCDLVLSVSVSIGLTHPGLPPDGRRPSS